MGCTPASAEELKASVRQVADATDTGNLDALDEHYAANVVCHRSPYPELDNPQGYRQWRKPPQAQWLTRTCRSS